MMDAECTGLLTSRVDSQCGITERWQHTQHTTGGGQFALRLCMLSCILYSCCGVYVCTLQHTLHQVVDQTEVESNLHQLLKQLACSCCYNQARAEVWKVWIDGGSCGEHH